MTIADIEAALPLDAIVRFTRENGLWCVTVYFAEGSTDTSVFVNAGNPTLADAMHKFEVLLAGYEREQYHKYLNRIYNEPSRATT